MTMLSLKSLLSVTAMAVAVLGNPTLHRRAPPAKTIAEVNQGTFLESIVTRPNGDLLATNSFNSTGVYITTNVANPRKRATKLVAPLPSVNFLLGIAPILTTDDCESYLVVGGNFSSFGPLTPIPDSWKAFKVSFKGKKAVATEAKAFPDPTLFLNGIATVPDQPNIVLITDSMRPAIGRLDLSTGDWDPDAFVYPVMASPPEAPLPVGVGSIKFRDDWMYFHNAVNATIYRVHTNADGTEIPGTIPELVADTKAVGGSIDDFIFDDEGNIWFTTTFSSNSVGVVVAGTGEVRHVLGSLEDDIVFASTSLTFGRTRKDRHILYVTTARDFADLGATSRIVAVDISDVL